jgi:F-box protein 9
VEFKYRRMIQTIPQKLPEPIEDTQELSETFERVQISQKRGWKLDSDSCPILDLPYEILTVIFSMAIYPRLETTLQLMQTCKLFYRVFLGESIWRYLCERAHDVPIESLEQELPDYNNSWKKMWFEKPRIRRDGIYISRCSYKRTGWSETLTYLQPVHLVVYYRYLRLLKNFTFIFLTTPQEPSEIVPMLQTRTKMKDVVHGAWSWDSPDTIKLEWQHSRIPSIVICAILKVSRTSTGRFNKLKWCIFHSCSGLFFVQFRQS